MKPVVISIRPPKLLETGIVHIEVSEEELSLLRSISLVLPAFEIKELP